jgi:hypothetical protein
VLLGTCARATEDAAINGKASNRDFDRRTGMTALRSLKRRPNNAPKTGEPEVVSLAQGRVHKKHALSVTVL